MVKASASRAENTGLRRFPPPPPSHPIPIESYQWLKNMALQWLSWNAPGVIGSVLGLVGPVSVYCDLVRWKVWSATSVSVWLHVILSEQIRPWDTPACCWDVKQPPNKQVHRSFWLYPTNKYSAASECPQKTSTLQLLNVPNKQVLCSFWMSPKNKYSAASECTQQTSTLQLLNVPNKQVLCSFWMSPKNKYSAASEYVPNKQVLCSFWMWQHVKLCRQVLPDINLAPCWQVRQPRNNSNNTALATIQLVLQHNDVILCSPVFDLSWWFVKARG